MSLLDVSSNMYGSLMPYLVLSKSGSSEKCSFSKDWISAGERFNDLDLLDLKQNKHKIVKHL